MKLLRPARIAPISAAVVVMLSANAHAQEARVDPARLDTGAKVYGSLCAACHGAEGDGVAGVNLRTGQFKTATTDLDLMNVILRGVPGTPMPPNKLGNADLLGLVAYIRNMKDYGARRVALGDAASGQAIFEGRGNCLGCHRVN